MKLSIVTTLYNSQNYLEEFYFRATETAVKFTHDYEIIFVNDGSPDNSLEVALKLRENDERLKVVDLSRNFGHHKALMCGLRYSCGEYVFLLDSDLEEEPELFETLYSALDNNECDMAVGVQEDRNGGFIKSFGGSLFYKFFNIFSATPVPAGVTTARVMTRRFVDALLQHEEKELFFAVLCAITGFKQTTIPVVKPYKGKTSYSFYRRLEQAVDAITSFSNKPLYIIFVIGWGVLLFSGSYIVWILVQKLFFEMRVGYASVIASIWAVGGLLMMCTGIIGIYLGKIFSETKNRPTVVKDVWGDFGGKKN